MASDQRTNAAGVGFLGEGSLEDSAKKETTAYSLKTHPSPKKQEVERAWILDFFVPFFKNG